MQANTANRILLHQRSSFELGPDFELGQNGTVLLNGKSNVQHRPSLLGMEQEAQEAREYKLWQVSAATPFCATRKPYLSAAMPILQANHPCILQQFQQFAQQSTGRRLVVFMDYDGKLLVVVEPEGPAGCQWTPNCPQTCTASSFHKACLPSCWRGLAQFCHVDLLTCQ